MKKVMTLTLTCLLLFSVFFSGCGTGNHGLDAKNPVTLTMWHNFGGSMQEMMDSLIDEFNSTVGKEQGIIINVTAISSSAELQEKYDMIVNDEPGAPDMPDITTCYPKTAILFQEKGLVANLNTYFTAEELEAYVPAFIEEGVLPDGGLYVFPFAKSTEILYVNQTLFDRFADATGVTPDCLNTFEGIADAAVKYYEWTDSQTPSIPNDGKQFFSADSWFNLAQAGMKQQGAELINNESLSLDNAEFARIWNTCSRPSVMGGFALYDGYSSDLSKTGDLVCSTGSSAGVLFYGTTITYADNTVEQVEYSILPYPLFESGEKVAIQRGNGMCIGKSDETKEYAASVFLKWFTEPEQNMRFIAQTGYLPVTNEAFGESMAKEIDSVPDPYIKKMLSTVTEMYNSYEFFVAPTFEAFDGISKSYESRYKDALRQQRDAYTPNPALPVENLSQNGLNAFKDSLDK